MRNDDHEMIEMMMMMRINIKLNKRNMFYNIQNINRNRKLIQYIGNNVCEIKKKMYQEEWTIKEYIFSFYEWNCTRTYQIIEWISFQC